MGNTINRIENTGTFLIGVKTFVLFSIAVIVAIIMSGGGVMKTKTSLLQDYVWSNLDYVNYKVGYLASIPSQRITWRYLFAADPKLVTPPEKNSDAKSVPVLVYHGVISSPDETNVTKSNFAQEMFALKRAGYQTITLQDFYQYMRGEKKLPDRSFLLTFDDGRKDSYYDADPILRALHYNAVMFVISRYSIDEPQTQNSKYYLNTAELKKMQSSGRWDIQAHTYAGHTPYIIDAKGDQGHFYSNKLWLASEGRVETDSEFAQKINSDFNRVKTDIEKNIGDKVTAFAFPFGDFGEESINYPQARQVILDNIYKYFNLTFYQFAQGKRYLTNYPFVASSSAAVAPMTFNIKRIDVKGYWTPKEFLNVLENAHAKSLPYQDDLSSNRGWISTWSNYQWSPGTLSLIPGQAQEGAAVSLDGTNWWKDYQMTAIVDSPRHDNVYAWARFQDDDNNLGCNFGNGVVQVVQTLGGNRKILKGVENPSIVIPSGSFQVGIKVVGRSVECSINGDPIVNTEFADSSLGYGGIGFKTWNIKPGEAKLLIHSVKVEPVAKGQ